MPESRHRPAIDRAERTAAERAGRPRRDRPPRRRAAAGPHRQARRDAVSASSRSARAPGASGCAARRWPMRRRTARSADAIATGPPAGRPAERPTGPGLTRSAPRTRRPRRRGRRRAVPRRDWPGPSATSPAVGIFQPRQGRGRAPRSGPATGSAASTCSASPRRSSPRRRRRRREPRRAGRGRRVRPGPDRHRVRVRPSRRRRHGPEASRCSARSSSPTAARSRCASCAPAATLGIEAVVAYSEADRDSLPVQLADEAICIGPADARRSYLSAPAVISAALVTGCDAIHPGYGFLSEDEGFAEVVARPRPDVHRPAGRGARAVRQQGRHAPAARRARPADDPGLRRHAARRRCTRSAEAERIGYPVLIKPSAGGGGKGMRMVRTPRELESVAARSAAREAQGGVRRRLALPREVARREPPRRGPGRRRPLRQRRPPRRARLLGPAPPPEDPRGGADAGARPTRHARTLARARRPGGRRGRLRERRARSSSSSTRRATSTSSRSTAGSRSSTRSPRC